MKTIIRWITVMTASLAFSSMFWIAVYVALLPDAPLYSTLDMLSFRIAFSVLTVLVAAGFVLNLKARQWIIAFAYAGLLVVIISISHAYLWGYEGQVNLTENEEPSLAENILLHKGPLSRPEVKPVTLFSVEDDKVVLVGPDGKESTLRAFELGPAPYLIISTNNGDLIESRYIKVLPGERKFFLIGFIPYKFIIEEAEEGLFHIELWRGKRLISQGEIGGDRTVMTDEVVVSIRDTRAWAGIRQRERPGEFSAVVGLIIFAFTFLLSLKKKGVRVV
jgi:hypothetical protein